MKLFTVTFGWENVTLRPSRQALQAYPDLTDSDHTCLLERAVKAEAVARKFHYWTADRDSVSISLNVFREHPDLPEALKARYTRLLEEAQAERARLAAALGDPRPQQAPTDSGEDDEGPAPRFEPYNPDEEREKLRQAIDEMLKRKGG
jgi:hypothetical protein